MKAIRYSQLHLLIFIIANSFLMITDCADSGRKRVRSEYATSPRVIGETTRNPGHTSGAATEAGSFNEEVFIWPKELTNEVFTTYYNNWRNGRPDWKNIFAILNARHRNLPPSKTLRNHIKKLLIKIFHTTPASGEGKHLWISNMKSELLRIYYQTKNGDRLEHATKMYNKWRNECPHFPDISSTDLLHQAENMIMRNDLLNLPDAISYERLSRIYPDTQIKFDQEQEDLLRKKYMKIPSNETISIEGFYEELCKKDPKFCRTTPRKVMTKRKNLMKDYERFHHRFQAPNEADEETNFLNQGRQEKQYHYHEFMDVRNDSLVNPQSAYHQAREKEGSSSLQAFTHENLGLDLNPGSGAVGTPRIHDPDLDLELSLSSQKKKAKSIWQQGSS